MHSFTRHAGSVIVAHHPDDLQQAIDVKEFELLQLYARRRHLSAAKSDVHPKSNQLLTRDQVLQLRIRGSPADVPYPSSGLPCTPQLGDIGSLDSIMFTITSEQRRIRSQISSQQCVNNTVGLMTQLEVWPKRAPPSEEFTRRLCRLHKASGLSSSVALPVEATARHRQASNTTLPVSPIVLEGTEGGTSDSVESYLNGISAILDACGEVRNLSHDDPESVRHVRFSSQSPQVTTFSVERPCAPHLDALAEEGTSSVECTKTPMLDPGKSSQRAELRRVQGAPSQPLVSTSSVKYTLAQNAHVTTEHHLSVSPQPTVTPFTLQGEEHCSFLLQVPRDAQGSSHHCHRDLHRPAEVTLDVKTAEKTLQRTIEKTTNEEDDKEEAATPSRPCAVVVAGEFVDSHDAAVADTGATAKSIPPDSDVASLSQVFKCFADSPPIFLCRHERKQVSPTLVFNEPPLLSNVPSRLTQLTAPSSRVSSTSAQTENQPPNTAKKKCVRFCESIGNADKAAAGAKCKRRRPNRRTVRCPVSVIPAAGVPTEMPAKLCCEQEGFCAGILLACGPTLFFD